MFLIQCLIFIFLYVVRNNLTNASLAMLLMSAQELLYAVKVVSIDSLLTTPLSNCLIKKCMEPKHPAEAAIV